MGVSDYTLLDLIEKVGSWICWGIGDTISSPCKVNMSDSDRIVCCQCEIKSEYHCTRCRRSFCESCVQCYSSFDVFESKNRAQADFHIQSCKFCENSDVKQEFSLKFHKVHPSGSEPQSPNCFGERFNGSVLQAVSVGHSLGRSDDDDETEDFARNFFSPYSLDTSDADSSSVSTRHEFNSFVSVGSSPSDSPSRIQFMSNRRRHIVQHEEHGTPRSSSDGSFDQEPMAVLKSHGQDSTEDPETTTYDDFKVFRDQTGKSNEPLDFENIGLIWFPPPPDDENTDVDNNFFSYASDDDDDEMGVTGCFTGKDRENEEHKKPLRNVVQGHFRALVSQLLRAEFKSAEEWLDVITMLAWQAANFVKPDTSRGGSMDPGDYVKIKCIASGSPSDSTFVKGVVCTKNIKHKRMTSQYKNPRLLILGGSLEYQRSHDQLASIETLLQQEINQLKMIVSRIEAHRPNVLLVEKNVSSYAQEYLLAKDISLVLNIKRPLLKCIARCTGAVVTPSVAKISTAQLGQCELFRLDKVSEDHEVANQFNKKLSKTLMFFEGCPRRLGCTILLKGSCREELKKVKHVIQFAIFAAYHLSLETSFLADEGASLPKMTLTPSGSTTPSSEEVTGSPSVVEGPTSQNLKLDGLGVAVDQENSSLVEDRDIEIVSDSLGDNIEASILVSFSSRCVLNGTVCERSRLLRIKFYGCFDKPLGRYLQDDLFDQTSSCQSCKEPAEAHVISYTHQQGNLTINVRRIPSLKLPGERDGKIWMWHRCLRCAHVDGVPPPTRRVVMSDSAWGLSFGKFLELSFSNHTTANRIASCGHSLQRDCLRFYSLGCMVAFFRYSPIDILSVHLPPSLLQFGDHVQQDWLKKEVAELSSKMESLYEDITGVLYGVEQKSTSFELSDSSELTNHVMELKDLLVKEREDYVDLLQPAREETLGAEMDVFELNRLRHSLVISLHVWDHRLFSLNLYKRSSSPKLSQGSEVNFLRSDSNFEDISNHDWGSKQNEHNEEPDTLAISFNQCKRDEVETDVEHKTSLERAPSAGSVLSDQIDSAWAGPLNAALHLSSTEVHEPSLFKQMMNQTSNPHLRRLSPSPARVHSFDSALRFQERMKKGLPSSSLHLSTLRSFHASGDYVHMVRDPVGNLQTRSFSQALPSDDPKLELLRASKPSFISSTSLIPEGAHLMLPYNGQNNIVIAVYDNEPTSMISYALTSKEYEEWVTAKPNLSRNSSTTTYVSTWQSFGSVDLNYINSGSYGSEDRATTTGSSFTDPKSSHLTISFEDESSPNGKVKFSVTCYFAKQFGALRNKCCPSEWDYVRSLSRCKRWSAQGGKSNVYFARSLDERFIIKQVTKTELESFEEFAPEYFKYLTDSLNSGSPTCLAKIVGIYQVTVKHLRGGKEAKMHVMVMENIFFGRKISRVYDLKGSTRSRYNSDTTGTNKTLLDTNLLEALRTNPIFLGSKAKRTLERSVWNDTSFLAAIDVIDYSLLVGVDDERKELVLGIIDFMRQYTWDKHLETWVKASGILGGPKNASPTIISPQQYKKRFRKAMTSYFLTVPDQWSSSTSRF